MQKLLDDIQAPLESQVAFAIKYTKAGASDSLVASLALWEDCVEALKAHRWAIRKGVDDEAIAQARERCLGCAAALLDATGDVASYRGVPYTEMLVAAAD